METTFRSVTVNAFRMVTWQLYYRRKYFCNGNCWKRMFVMISRNCHSRWAKWSTPITEWKYFWISRVDNISFSTAVQGFDTTIKGRGHKNLRDFRNYISFQLYFFLKNIISNPGQTSERKWHATTFQMLVTSIIFFKILCFVIFL